MAFEKVPDAFAFDTALSFGARALYPVLRSLAWKAGRRREEDAVRLPSQREIAAAFGCSTSSLYGYLRELRDRGWIAMSGSGPKAALYVIREVASDSESDALVTRNPSRKPSREREESLDLSDGLRPSGSDPPSLVKVDGRNLGFDAIADVCKISSGSPREREIPVALFGSRTVGAGIREQFFRGLLNAHVSLGEDPERFEYELAAEIRRRAKLWPVAFRNATMTPTALQKWWSDLPRMAEDARGGLSPEQIMERYG